MRPKTASRRLPPGRLLLDYDAEDEVPFREGMKTRRFDALSFRSDLLNPFLDRKKVVFV